MIQLNVIECIRNIKWDFFSMVKFFFNLIKDVWKEKKSFGNGWKFLTTDFTKVTIITMGKAWGEKNQLDVIKNIGVFKENFQYKNCFSFSEQIFKRKEKWWKRKNNFFLRRQLFLTSKLRSFSSI